MDFLYEQFDENTLREVNLGKLSRLFLELLNQSSGDVDRALGAMERMWDMYDLESKTGIGFDEFKDYLEEQRLLETNPATGVVQPTARADIEIQRQAFEEIFSGLSKGELGNHAIPYSGHGGERLPETREYQWGDSIADINFTSSIGNALVRSGFDEFSMAEEDLEAFETEHLTSTATVILIDISHSMILYGEDRITPAKKVALALVEYIQQRYPKDTIDVVLFGDEAHEVPLGDLPRISVGPYHTNTKAGLEMSQNLLMRRKAANKQVFMITDGKPSAITEAGHIYKNPFGLDPKIVNQTINEAVQLRRKNITITTFMITDDPYLQDFVDRLTEANRGKAYYADLNNLGKFIFADYRKNKKKYV